MIGFFFGTIAQIVFLPNPRSAKLSGRTCQTIFWQNLAWSKIYPFSWTWSWDFLINLKKSNRIFKRRRNNLCGFILKVKKNSFEFCGLLKLLIWMLRVFFRKTDLHNNSHNNDNNNGSNNNDDNNSNNKVPWRKKFRFISCWEFLFRGLWVSKKANWLRDWRSKAGTGLKIWDFEPFEGLFTRAISV